MYFDYFVHDNSGLYRGGIAGQRGLCRGGPLYIHVFTYSTVAGWPHTVAIYCTLPPCIMQLTTSPTAEHITFLQQRPTSQKLLYISTHTHTQ